MPEGDVVKEADCQVCQQQQLTEQDLNKIEEECNKCNNNQILNPEAIECALEVVGEEHHHHMHKHEDELPSSHALEAPVKRVKLCGVDVTPLILLLALSFHSIFEGIALGLIDNVRIFINLMIGVTLHHIAASISLGVSLGQHKTESKKAIFFIFFGLSFIESTGIGIGMALESTSEIVSSIVLSIAGGTFVYIACSEILVHEFDNMKHRYIKFLFFILGSGVIVALWFLNKDA